MNLNPGCDGANCTSSKGEIRALPVSTNPDHGNMLLCRSCYDHELKHRRNSNHRRSEDSKYQTPKWNDLKIYQSQNNRPAHPIAKHTPISYVQLAANP